MSNRFKFDSTGDDFVNFFSGLYNPKKIKTEFFTSENCVEICMPGCNKEDINISVVGNVLEVNAKSSTHWIDDTNFKFRIRDSVEVEEAIYENGILKITFKINEKNSYKIPIK